MRHKPSEKSIVRAYGDKIVLLLGLQQFHEIINVNDDQTYIHKRQRIGVDN
jgi:hypothetical protein